MDAMTIIGNTNKFRAALFYINAYFGRTGIQAIFQ